MIKLLHTADLHLGARFPSLGEREGARQAAFFKTFEHLLTTAIKCEVDLMVIAGDLFDRPRPDASVVGQVQAGLQRLAERGITPVLLPGTHDSVVPGDSVYRRSEFPGAIVLDRPTVEEPVRITIRGEDVFLYGFAYRSFLSERGLDSMVRRPEDGIHIGLLHGSQQGRHEWDCRKKDLPFTLAELKSWGLDYVALGHYHQFELLQEGGRIYACYPGAPEGKRFGENGPRYCAMVNVSSGNVSLEQATANALAVLEFAGRPDVPVAAGSPRPLLRAFSGARLVHGESGLGAASLPAPRGRPRDVHAVDLLIETVSASPGQITLVATGPLTNIALAVCRYPQLVSQVADFVIMGGSATRGNVPPAAEFNIACAPEAAAIVFSAGWGVSMAGLNVTRQARAGRAVQERMAGLGRLGAALDRAVMSHIASATIGSLLQRMPRQRMVTTVVRKLTPERSDPNPPIWSAQSQ